MLRLAGVTVRGRHLRATVEDAGMGEYDDPAGPQYGCQVPGACLVQHPIGARFAQHRMIARIDDVDFALRRVWLIRHRQLLGWNVGILCRNDK